MKNETNGFTTGVASLVFAAMANVFIPGSPVIVYGSYALGCLSIAMHLADKIDKWKKIFTACKLNTNDKVPLLQEKTKTDTGYVLRFNVVEGLTLSKMLEKKEAIENYIGKKIDITYNNRNFFIEVFEKRLATQYNFEIPDYDFLKGISFPVGYSLKGPEWLELSEDSPHLLIAGMSGSGKSVFLRSVLTSIVLLHDRYKTCVNLHLVDFKYGAEFNVFRKCKCVKSFSRTVSECVNILKEINKKIDERYDMFYQRDVVNINEYNNRYKKRKMSYELIFIDEFASLMEGKDKTAQDILINISQKARACGIFLVISTQRPDAKIIPGLIKANIQNIIGLKCITGINSRIVWDREGLENLKGKGHCLIRKGSGEETEIQGMFLSAAQAKNLIKHTYIEKKVVSTAKKTTKEVGIEKKNKVKNGKINNFDFLEVIDNAKECKT